MVLKSTHNIYKSCCMVQSYIDFYSNDYLHDDLESKLYKDTWRCSYIRREILNVDENLR